MCLRHDYTSNCENINIVFLTYNKYMFSRLYANQYKAHSVLLKLLYFNLKLFTQRSRMLRLNWMHFLHFCKQKFTALNYCIVQRILLERKGYEGN